MSKRLIQLTLPEFTFVEGSGHEVGGNPTMGRNIILHTRSASVLEIIAKKDLYGIEPNVLKYEFTHLNEEFLVGEDFVILLHYCATMDKDLDRQSIIDNVMIPASKWFSDYCDWEDENIANERFSKFISIKKAILINAKGDRIKVNATTEHPDSH